MAIFFCHLLACLLIFLFGSSFPDISSAHLFSEIANSGLTFVHAELYFGSLSSRMQGEFSVGCVQGPWWLPGPTEEHRVYTDSI